MSQTQSGVGLITGLNISQLVSELMTVSEQPVTALNNQNTQLQNEQTAYQTLMADLLGVQNAAKSLQQSSPLHRQLGHQQQFLGLDGHGHRHPGAGHLPVHPLADGPSPAVAHQRLPEPDQLPGRRPVHLPLRRQPEPDRQSG